MIYEIYAYDESKADGNGGEVMQEDIELNYCPVCGRKLEEI